MNKYTEELKKILKGSELIAKEKRSIIGSEHILLSCLKIENSIYNNLKEYNISYDKINNLISTKEKSDYTIYSDEILKTIEKIIISKSDTLEEITLPTLVIKLLENKSTNMYKLLKKINIDIDKLILDIKQKEIETESLLVKKIGTNINEEVKKGNIDKVIGRDKEINELIEILARKNKNNPILIGEAGVGKTAIVEELARRITENNVPKFLKNKEIINLNLGKVIAGTKYRGEFEEKLSKIIEELESSNNLILFIDEIHTVVGAGGAEGAIDASNILKPALARGKIKCIGATTLEEFKSSIEKDKALERRFQKIYVKEPNNEETKIILKKIKKDYENFHNVIIPDNILDLTIKLTNKYLKYRKNPDKSIDILDEVCAMTKIKEKNNEKSKLENKILKLTKEKNKFLLNNDILKASLIKKEINDIKNKLNDKKEKESKNKVTLSNLKKVLENKTNSKIYELENYNYLKVLNSSLKEKIYNQSDGIKELVKITENVLNLDNEKPISVLLQGNTGCGKTKLINEYSKILNLNLIKLDMLDYNKETSINKILGSNAGYVGYNEKNTTFESIKTFPISIIFIENYKEGNYNVLNLIKNILETSKLELANNDKLYFNNCLFIFTETTYNKEKIGFINEENDVENKEFNYCIRLNNLKEENIIKIIKDKLPNIKNEDLEYILSNSNYKKENAKNIDKLIEKINTKELIKNL